MQRPNDRQRSRNRARGFTLLEIVVVLVIVSLTSAIVFPRLVTMAASFEFAAQRDSFEQALSGLSYRAYRDNDDKILQGLYTAAGRDPAKQQRRDPSQLAAKLRTLPQTPNSREEFAPVTASYAQIILPEGWEVVIDEPIYFRGSGYCSGGNVELFVGSLQYSYELRPPLCRAHLVE